MVKNILSAAVAATVLMSANFASAESYVGVSFGTVDYGRTSLIEDDAVSAGITLNSSSTTESDSGSKFYYGYKVTPAVAVELFYADLGKSGSSGSGVSGIVAVDYQSEEEVSSIGVAAVYQFDTDSSFEPFVKLGLHRWDLDIDFSATASVAGFSATDGFSGSASGTDIFYGVGFDFSMTESWAIRAEYEVFDIDTNLVEDASMLSLGLKYQF